MLTNQLSPDAPAAMEPQHCAICSLYDGMRGCSEFSLSMKYQQGLPGAMDRRTSTFETTMSSVVPSQVR